MQLDFLGDLRRTHVCGELRAQNAGEQVVLMGWVNRRRDLGNLIFIDLRDRTGTTQLVFDHSSNPALHDKASSLRSEFVVAAIGKVRRRDEETVNRNIATGEVEVAVSELRLLNESKLPPFLPSETGPLNEEVRLKYRYLDLRREPMQFNIELRHKVALAIRQYLSGQGFFEIETPFMTRSTPEGARDYLVPSRVHPGSFYALPQSPQLFKQILMISGFDKYFQIVRCFRDEDLRADRQPEFTQIDLEMTFPQPDRVYEVVEGFLKAAFKAAGHELKTPFPRMQYDEAIRQYGIDKPDLRLPGMTDMRAAFTEEDLAALNIDGSMNMVAIRIPKIGKLSDREKKEIRTLSEEITKRNKDFAGVFYDFIQLEKKRPEAAAKIRQLCAAEADDLIVPVVGIAGKNFSEKNKRAQYVAAGEGRLELARKYADRHGAFKRTGDPDKDFKWLWVTDFPMFEYDDKENRWAAAHHPFTSPHERDMDKLESDPGAVRALAYDVVLNGTELGSGSIRIHRQDIQRKIFHALGMTDEEARSRFGFFLEALEYGTPPHGGIALGLDRIVMILAGADSLREVIPFPKTAKAIDLMVDAPSQVETPQEDQLELMAAFPDLSPEDWQIAKLGDDLFTVIDQELPRITAHRNLTSLQLAMMFTLTKAYNDARAAIRLAKSGYGPQAANLARVILEGAINARFVQRNPSNAKKLLRTMLQDAAQLASDLLKQNPAFGSEKVIIQALKLKERVTWPSVEKRISTLHDIDKQAHYRSAWTLLSDFAEYKIGSISSVTRFETTRFSIRMGRGPEVVNIALTTTFDFLWDLSDAMLHSFGIDSTSLKSLRERFTRYLQQTTR